MIAVPPGGLDSPPLTGARNGCTSPLARLSVPSIASGAHLSPVSRLTTQRDRSAPDSIFGTLHWRQSVAVNPANSVARDRCRANLPRPQQSALSPGVSIVGDAAAAHVWRAPKFERGALLFRQNPGLVTRGKMRPALERGYAQRARFTCAAAASPTMQALGLS